jgi:cellulose synthase/poly-beta-1,6-N-acetylglucosamine synthase-like glycosyltransferase
MVHLGDWLIALFFWVSVGAIVYTYFGYPILIALLAFFRSQPPPHPRNGEPQGVTLLIAAYNEEIAIEDKIKNSLSIDYPKERFQILIVTDGSSDRTPQIVETYASRGVELMHQPERRGKMAAINRAIAQTRGEIIVFSDANNFYQPDTIQKLVAPFNDPTVGAVSGAKVIQKGDGSLGESEGLYWKYESFIKKQESKFASCTSAAGEILALRKDLFEPPPGNVINDDFFLAMQVLRKGYRVSYAPEAKSSERVSQTAQDEIVRRTRINAGRYQAIALARQFLPFKRPVLIWQIVSHKFMRPLVPFFMIGAFLANLLAVLLSNNGGFWTLGRPFGFIFLALQVGFYALALLGSRVQQRQGQGKLARLLYLPAFLTNSNLAALKGFFRFMRGGEGHLWQRIQRR